MLKSRGPGDVSLEDPLSANLPLLALTATGWAPAALESSDVDMQPAGGRMAWLPGTWEDTEMMEEDQGSPEAGRPQGKARGSWPRPQTRDREGQGTQAHTLQEETGTFTRRVREE